MHTRIGGSVKALIGLFCVAILFVRGVPTSVVVLAAVVYHSVLMALYRRYIYYCTKRLAPDLTLEMHRILTIRVSGRPDLSGYPEELLQLIQEYDSAWKLWMMVFAALLIRQMITE